MTNEQSKNAAPATSLVLRVCKADYTSHSDFLWPSEIGAEVVAPDWKNDNKCGNGLHGWLYGQGDCGCVEYWMDDEAKWMVLEVPSSEIVMLGGKCKFPRAKVRYIGTRSFAADFIIANEPKALNVAVIGARLMVGDDEVVRVGCMGTATAGKRGTAIAGDFGTATVGSLGLALAGYQGTATAGESSVATAGYRGTAMVGYCGRAMAGDYGTATAGDHSTAMVGFHGTATAGESGTARAAHQGTATVGDYGTATVGDYGTARAGHRGRAMAGYLGRAAAGAGGEIHIQWLDNKAKRHRTKIGYVGEDGIEADTLYRLNDDNEFEEVKGEK